jgi:quercetin dioxygenase-like cupin family protein
MSNDVVRKHRGPFAWDGVPTLRYKDDGSAPFRDVTRQVLFSDPHMPCELRYFEVAAGGHTTLERHVHVHNVMVLRGRGRCIVGNDVHRLDVNDLVTVPPLAWHQFHADPDAPLGFLCMVPTDRDRPQLPDDEEAARLRRLQAP